MSFSLLLELTTMFTNYTPTTPRLFLENEDNVSSPTRLSPREYFERKLQLKSTTISNSRVVVDFRHIAFS